MKRPGINELCQRVKALADSLSIDLAERLENLDLPQLKPTQNTAPASSNGMFTIEAI